MMLIFLLPAVAAPPRSAHLVDVGHGLVVARTSPEFLSFNIDAFELVAPRSNSSTPFAWGSTKLASRARHLLPAKLRVGGGNQGDVQYDAHFLAETWPAILDLARSSGMALVWGSAPSVSAAEVLAAQPRSSEVVEWEFGNEPAPSKCCAESATADPCGCRTQGCCTNATVLGRQFVAFAAMLNRTIQRRNISSAPPTVVGPDIGYGGWWPTPAVGSWGGNWLGEFLRAGAADVLSAATIHVYPFDHEDVGGERVYPLSVGGDPACNTSSYQWCNASRILWPSEMPNAHRVQAFTEPFAAIMQRLAPRAATSLRIGETAAVDLGGVSGVTDSFGHGFWATYQYGMLAQAGYVVVHRQVLACTSLPLPTSRCAYGVLSNSPAFEALPDFWWSVLYKRLMGATVLAINVTSSSEERSGSDEGPMDRLSGIVRVYAHCTFSQTSNRSDGGGGSNGSNGSVTIMWANPQPHPVSLTFSNTGSLGGAREEYHLTAAPAAPAGVKRNVAATLASTRVKLNGRLLQLLPLDELPPLQGLPVMPASPHSKESIGSMSSMELAGLSYGFTVFTDAGVAACSSSDSRSWGQ